MMDAGVVHIKERILMSRMIYFILQEEIENHEKAKTILKTSKVHMRHTRVNNILNNLVNF
jgi:hypothetical protein